jgi:membrane-bound metal-dependent hydrolase YbcI (DUF457 family)
MPGKQEHQIAAAGISFMCELVRQQYLRSKGIKLDPTDSLLGLVIAPLAGAFGGVLPDKLEPATDYNHRAFCHSITSGSALVYGLTRIPINGDNRIANLMNVGLRSCFIGSLTHLIQDSTTPMGLPVV